MYKHRENVSNGANISSCYFVIMYSFIVWKARESCQIEFVLSGYIVKRD